VVAASARTINPVKTVPTDEYGQDVAATGQKRWEIASPALEYPFLPGSMVETINGLI
jgi:hypothetical protein